MIKELKIASVLESAASVQKSITEFENLTVMVPIQTAVRKRFRVIFDCSLSGLR